MSGQVFCKARDHVCGKGKGLAYGSCLQIAVGQGLWGNLEMIFPVGEEVFLARKAPGACGNNVCSV